MNVPIHTLFLMLCYAWDMLEEKDTIDVDVLEYSELQNLLTRVLISGTNNLLRQGLDRGYILHGELLHQVRGKIDFGKTIKNSALNPNRLYCQFDDLDHDIIHNQIIKSTLFDLSHSPKIDGSLRTEAYRIADEMDTISLITLSSNVFQKVQLDRNRRVYDFLIKVCGLIFEGLFAFDNDGRYEFSDFFQDENKMWKLFQNFVRNFYSRQLKGDWTIKATIMEWQEVITSRENKSYLPNLNTDITITSPHRSIIIDTKYYKAPLVKRFDKELLRGEHLYQILSYLQNYSRRFPGESVEGILLYSTLDKEFNFEYNIFGFPLKAVGIDLSQNWNSIEAQLLAII